MSKEEFLLLLEKNKGLIYKVANSYCKNNEDRKDLVQEIIIQLWRSFDRYDHNYKLSTWMYRVALNTAISFYRKENKRKDVSLPLMEEFIEVAEENLSEDLETNIGLLQQFINELKELDKALMILYLEESSYKEMAEILGITETNVATKISRIKEKLKQRFSLVNN
ncbi:sigma-70 family RNA polymerase sigma factor [Solitalea sp. MAHUQ-68]|uniref:Sigma-70 family RNA polymerase sigma factor n=1 Tax=Solitalea agri TaxID=2953739 RepID=A0A9X2F4Q9_9SPHI|nr:sigma-70 family RNA polymerase sigma factor [Solitalea agri]MCO4294687.1 sigma-70 family RNA polymerase sigma factor [Solitalea agri]